MLICQTAEIKEGVFGQENFSSTDGTIKDYIFRQFDLKEFTKSHTVYIPEQKKTPLQESVDEILEWQEQLGNKWTEQDRKKRETDDYIGAGLVIIPFLGVVSFILLLILKIGTMIWEVLK
jgi:hypothetical protein